MSHEIRDGKTVWWLYQARRVLQQDGGAGGALVARIAIPTGTVAYLVHFRTVGPATNSGNNIYIYDEDGATHLHLAGAAAANCALNLPSVGAAASAAAAIGSSLDLYIGPGQYLVVSAASAAVTETLTTAVSLLMSTPTEPTWDTTGSGGTPDLQASTISAANTLQAVVL